MHSGRSKGSTGKKWFKGLTPFYKSFQNLDPNFYVICIANQLTDFYVIGH